MKPLIPSHRENKRYLLVKGRGNLKENIIKAIHEFLGIQGESKANLTFIDVKTDSTIVSINREMLNQVRAAICIFPEKMEVMGVSGTIKGLRSKEK